MIVKSLDSLTELLKRLKRNYIRGRIRLQNRINSYKKWGENPNVSIYAHPDFSDILLNNWGKDNVWNEIKLLIALCRGKILDIACGTGEVIDQLKPFDHCSFYGCDVVSVLIEKAKQKGIPEEQLQVCNASKLPYPDSYFDFSYSIGSFHCMESEQVITEALKESGRVTKNAFFFQVATSRRNRDEGLIRFHQHFYNNSVGWWKNKCLQIYDKVFVLDSQWNDAVSDGKWFLCFKN